MRELTSHKTNSVNDALAVRAMDGPGPGGASHYYEIRHTETDPSKSFVFGLLFQDGPPAEGVNGITNETLLAVLIDRLEGFQEGPYRCVENAAALSHLLAAQATLKARTASRAARGVEGTMTV